MPVTLVEMTPEHYDQVYALWMDAIGVGMSEADQIQPIARYLSRNPGLSLVALDGDLLVGAALCGHDGRRGFIHHLAVRKSYRRRGIGQALARRCLASLKEQGIDKCHIFVFHENQEALAFWKNGEWIERTELIILSQYT